MSCAPRSWRCPLCSYFAAPSLKGTMRHIGSVHAHESNFHVICGIQGCPRSYTNFHTFKKHMYQKHRETLEAISTPGLMETEPNQSVDFECDSSYTDTETPIVAQQGGKTLSALFLLKTSTVSKVSQVALNDLIGDVSFLLSNTLQSLKDDVSAVLHQKDVEFGNELTPVFEKPSLTSPFQGLHSQFLRRKFYVEKMGLLVSYLSKAWIIGPNHF